MTPTQSEEPDHGSLLDHRSGWRNVRIRSWSRGQPCHPRRDWPRGLWPHVSRRNFTGFIELGLTPEHVGGTPEQIQAFSPRLYNYISHLQVAVAGFIIALGVAVITLAWRGIRAGQRWALWTAFLAPVIGVGLALPLHYAYGLGTFGHLGLIYLDAGILLIGTILARKALPR